MTTPVGLDFGNGFIKIVIDNKASKIPAGYSMTKPQGVLNTRSGFRAKSKAFNLLFNNQSLWFGQDILSVVNIRELDALKYNPQHIMILFKAALYHWSKQHRVDIELLGRLCIIASMPPDLFSDRSKYQVAYRAYSKAFNTTKPIYIRTEDKTIRISTKLLSLKREAISYIEVNQSRLPGYTLLMDLGYGTIDSGLFLNGDANPVFISTKNNGLLHAYASIDELNPDDIELKVMAKDSVIQQVKPYLNTIKNNIVLTQRRLESKGGLKTLILIGGGTRLMDSTFKSSLRGIAPNLVIKDEFENARSNLKFAQREVVNGIA